MNTGHGGEAVVVRPAAFATDLPALSALVVDYMTWAVGRLQDEYEQTLPVPDADAAAESLRKFNAPGAVLLTACSAGQLVGMGALRTLEQGVAEVKRMYLKPAYQGRGWGSLLLERLTEQARDTLGAATVRLDTCRFMVESQRLYERRGFTERTPYEGTEIPGELQRYWRFYERKL